MPQPYSYDLRSKAIATYENGKNKIEISRYFNISRNTLDLWLKRKEETGDIKANKPGPKESKTKIKDLEKFRLFILENKEKTQKVMAELWGNNITQQNISYGCKKLKITRKKKPLVIKKEMKNREKNLRKN